MTRQQQIQERAYYLWQAAGKPLNRDLEFWHKAEGIYDYFNDPSSSFCKSLARTFSPYMGDSIVITNDNIPQTIIMPPPSGVQFTYTEAPAWPYVINVQNLTTNGPHATAWVQSDELH